MTRSANLRTFTRLAGASLIVTSSMVACSGAKMEHRPALASSQASGIALGIEKALQNRDFARALLDAERLVEAQPRDAAARSLLGRAYLANGRYLSARTAFEDAMELGASDPRTIVSLSLVRSALGSADSARALLSSNIDHLPASDYGLAMAMAGDTQEGVRALVEASQQPDADAKTRQNLAYALALGGEWDQARLVAGQDLTGSQLQDRLAQWAASAQPDATTQRVAALIGVAPRGDDSGLPQHLALSNSAPTSMAEVQPLEPAALAGAAGRDAAAMPAESAEIAAPMSGPAPQTVAMDAQPEEGASADAAFPQPSAAPLIQAPADPMREAVMARIVERPAPRSRAAANAFARPRGSLDIVPARTARGAVHGGSDWVVQIGAFDNDGAAATGWKRAHGTQFSSSGYRKVTSRFALGGRNYVRVAMSGFADRATAAALCTSLKAQGQSCFVRRDAGVASDIRMAAVGKSTKVAMAGKPATAKGAIKSRATKVASR